MTSVEKVSGALALASKGGSDQVDLSAERLADVLKGIESQYPELSELAASVAGDARVLVAVPKLEQVINAKRLHDNEPQDLNPPSNDWDD